MMAAAEVAVPAALENAERTVCANAHRVAPPKNAVTSMLHSLMFSNVPENVDAAKAQFARKMGTVNALIHPNFRPFAEVVAERCAE